MSDIKEILEGFNVGYIIQQKRPEVYQQLEKVLEEVDLPFFESFIKGGIESKEKRIKSLMLDKNFRSPSQETPNKEMDIDMDI